MEFTHYSIGTGERFFFSDLPIIDTIIFKMKCIISSRGAERSREVDEEEPARSEPIHTASGESGLPWGLGEIRGIEPNCVIPRSQHYGGAQDVNIWTFVPERTGV